MAGVFDKLQLKTQKGDERRGQGQGGAQERRMKLQIADLQFQDLSERDFSGEANGEGGTQDPA